MDNKLKKYEIIDANQELRFHTHTEIIRDCFGVELSTHRMGHWKLKDNEEWIVTFPREEKDSKGNVKVATGGWINTLSPDGSVITEVLIDESKDDYLDKHIYMQDCLRLVFLHDAILNDYVFRGVFRCDMHETTNKNHVFKRVAARVRLIGDPVYKIEMIDEDKVIEPLDDSYSEEEKKAHAESMDLESLRLAAIKHTVEKPVEIETTVKVVKRDPYIAQYAKERANGICQLCGKEGPFIGKNGKPYLESHHIVSIADGGADSIENTIALCPNCHRKMHHAPEEHEVEFLRDKPKIIHTNL